MHGTKLQNRNTWLISTIHGFGRLCCRNMTSVTNFSRFLLTIFKDAWSREPRTDPAAGALGTGQSASEEAPGQCKGVWLYLPLFSLVFLCLSRRSLCLCDGAVSASLRAFLGVCCAWLCVSPCALFSGSWWGAVRVCFSVFLSRGVFFVVSVLLHVTRS